MASHKPLRRCPQCQVDLEKTTAALRDITELPFCLECKFPLMLVANKYRLRKLLAQGGFGKVYLARHVQLDRDPDRVIKVLDPDVFAIKGMEARFRREVQVTGALSQLNEHIVRIYDDFGAVPKLGHFYVMEYLQGSPLTKLLLRPDKLPSLKLCFHIFSQLCDAMDAAHQEEVVHRDLKPDNIFLIERKGDPYYVKVLDFGIAKPMDREALQTTQMTQGTLGTPPYMSPEQCNDEPLDHRADIYAMGIIFYEMLVGHTPFFNRKTPRSALRVLQDHLLVPPPPIRELRPDRDVPEEIENVIMKALSKSPDARFESAKHFQRALATAYLSAGLELPKSPEEIEKQSWNTMNQSASADTFGGLPQSGNAWPIPDSTALPNQRLFDSEQGIYKGLDSAANRPDHLRQSNAVQTGEQLHNRNALNESQAAQSNTDQHPIRKDIPDNPKAIHRNSDLHNVVREDFVTFDSAQYDIGCLGEDSGEWDDEDDDFEDQLAINRSYRPLLVLFAILIAGGLWGLLVISSWNESKRTTNTLLPQVGAVCGNTVKTWKKGAVRLLILPLLPRNANRPHSPIRAKRFAALKQIQQNIQNHLQKAAHPLHHDFLSIHVSAMGFSQVDPTLNRARARMYGELCKADIVLSGGWFDAGNNTQLQPTSTKNGVDKAFWIRMFSTFTGKRLFAKHNKKQVFLPTPPDIDELVRSNAVQLPGPRLRHFIQGLVRLRAANIMSESLFLSPHLLVRAFDSFRQAGTLNPAQLPLVAQLKQRNMKQRETVFVPAGTFWMNKNNQLIKQHLPNFWIDKYEVSREEYAICVLKGQCPAVRNFLSASWSLPRDRVTTKAARTFCKQEGKTLPTEEQWIKAARGGIVLNGKPNPYPKRQYTWGKPDSFPKGQQTALCQLTHVFKCYRALVEGDLVATMISTHRHLKGISPYGAHHMHGNASELLDNGSIKGGDGYGLLHPISWKGHMDQRDGLSWVGFRCVRAK